MEELRSIVEGFAASGWDLIAVPFLLENCNNGHRKGFFALAVNLLELEGPRSAVEQLAAEPESLPLKEKTSAPLCCCRPWPKQQGIELKTAQKARNRQKLSRIWKFYGRRHGFRQKPKSRHAIITVRRNTLR